MFVRFYFILHISLKYVWIYWISVFLPQLGFMFFSNKFSLHAGFFKFYIIINGFGFLKFIYSFFEFFYNCRIFYSTMRLFFFFMSFGFAIYFILAASCTILEKLFMIEFISVWLISLLRLIWWFINFWFMIFLNSFTCSFRFQRVRGIIFNDWLRIFIEIG